MNNKRFLIGRTEIMKELALNVFSPLVGEDSEPFYSTVENDNKTLLSYDYELMNDTQMRALEALLYIRHADGLMAEVYIDENMSTKYQPLDSDNQVLRGAFELTANSEKEAKELFIDIFQASDVTNVHMSFKPVAPNMLSFTCISMLAVGLTDDEINKLDKCTSTKQIGKKARKIMDTISTRSYSSARIIAKDIVEPGAEVIGKLGGLAAAAAVNSGFKASATFADEMLKNCNKDELLTYEPYLRAKAGFKALFSKSGNTSGGIRSRKL